MEKKYEENYTLGRQSNFAEGFAGPKGDVGFTMVVDEKKAKRIIVETLKKESKKIKRAELGLEGDFSVNSTVIYDGEFHEYDVYNHSNWATPILIITFVDGTNRKYESWKRQSN